MENLENNNNEEVVDNTPKEEVVENTNTEEKAEETKTEETNTEETNTEEKVVREPKVVTPHDEFDWSLGKSGQNSYTEQEISDYLNSYDQTLSIIKEFEIVGGRVVEIRDSDVVIDLNYKSDGLIPLSEFRDTPDLKVDDVIEVYVETQEDKHGRLVLSRRKAKLLRAWDNIATAFVEGTVVTGTVISKTKGGLIVDVNGLETFLPGSQIDIKPIIDYDAYVGKSMEYKVVKINEAIKNAVVSHKALIESDLEAQRMEIIGKLERGQVLEGTVKNITDFGAFLDLGGVDGLLYITDISWGRIKHPSDVLENGQKLNVVVLDFNDDKKRISLGLKQLHPHPWDVLADTIQPGSIVEGKIVNIEDYGAFLEITPGVEGLIHVSEVSWSSQPINSRDYFKEGEIFNAKVVTIDREDRKMSLSLKQLTEDPWAEIEAKYPKDSRHVGEVKNLTPYGVFIELEEGIGGMIHISDLSWTKRFGHPGEFTKIGDNLDVMILDVDKDNRKLSLGHKQLEENPWDTFENVFPIGSVHEATVVRRDDRGAIVQLPYGLEAFAPIRHIKKEDGTLAELEETLLFKVIEFNRDDKRILVSHTRYYQDMKKDQDDTERGEKRKEQKEQKEVQKKHMGKVEKSTLGELSAFSELREQLENEEKSTDEKKDEKKDGE